MAGFVVEADGAGGIRARATDSQNRMHECAPVTRCGHLSDCAVHHAPAMEPGPCDCGARDRVHVTLTVAEVRAVRALVEAVEDGMGYETREAMEARDHDQACFQPSYKYAPAISRALGDAALRSALTRLGASS